MKKFLTFICLFTLISNVFAQSALQRNFLGFSLLDSKQKVVQTLKQRNLKFTEEENEKIQIIVVQPVSFGGINWKEVELSFFNNKLFAVRFFKPEDNNMQYELNKLAKDLVNKYGYNLVHVNTRYDDPNKVTNLAGQDSFHTEVVLDYLWGGLVLKYFDQRVAYESMHPGFGDL